MINDVGELFLQLMNIGELKKYPSLLLLDSPSVFDLQKWKIPEIKDANSMYIICSTVIARSELDIFANTTFDILISCRGKEYMQYRSILKKISINPKYDIDYLPGGHTGLCLLEFPEGKSELLNKLATSSETKNYFVHDTLILTQKSILDIILNKLPQFGIECKR